MISPLLKAAVIGAGSIGHNHVRIYNEMVGVELVGVVEPIPASAEQIQRTYRVPVFPTMQIMLEQIRPDLASVAVPTSLHFSIASRLLQSGIHVLVEKPIANTLEEGRELIKLARSSGVLLSVGHIERFNPAVKELKRRLDSNELGRVFTIQAQRQGPFPQRIRDVGVIIDLATHDLDLMLWLIGSQPLHIFGETARNIHTDHEDLVSGLVRFANGTIGVLNINWLTPTKVRQLSICGEKGMFVVNYLTQQLTFYRNAQNSHGTYSSIEVLTGVSEGEMIRYPIASQEPLRVELESFVRACSGKSAIEVTGEDGLMALYMAQLLRKAGQENQIQFIQAMGTIT